MTAAGEFPKAGRLRPEHLELTENGDTKLQGEGFCGRTSWRGETYLYVNTEKNKELTVHATGRQSSRCR